MTNKKHNYTLRTKSILESHILYEQKAYYNSS